MRHIHMMMAVTAVICLMACNSGAYQHTDGFEDLGGDVHQLGTGSNDGNPARVIMGFDAYESPLYSNSGITWTHARLTFSEILLQGQRRMKDDDTVVLSTNEGTLTMDLLSPEPTLLDLRIPGDATFASIDFTLEQLRQTRVYLQGQTRDGTGIILHASIQHLLSFNFANGATYFEPGHSYSWMLGMDMAALAQFISDFGPAPDGNGNIRINDINNAELLESLAPVLGQAISVYFDLNADGRLNTLETAQNNQVAKRAFTASYGDESNDQSDGDIDIEMDDNDGWMDEGEEPESFYPTNPQMPLFAVPGPVIVFPDAYESCDSSIDVTVTNLSKDRIFVEAFELGDPDRYFMVGGYFNDENIDLQPNESSGFSVEATIAPKSVSEPTLLKSWVMALISSTENWHYQYFPIQMTVHPKPTHTDHFDATVPWSVDYLYVINTNESMLAYKAEMLNTIEYIFEDADQKGFSAAINIMTCGGDMMAGGPVTYSGPGTVTDREQATLALQDAINQMFSEHANSGTQCMEAARLAFENQREQLGLRNHASTDLLFITDAEDTSPLTVEEYNQAYEGVWNAYFCAKLRVDTIVSPCSGGCDDIEKGCRYAELKNMMGTASNQPFRICSASWNPYLDDTVKENLRYDFRFPFSEELFDSHNVKVTVDGEAWEKGTDYSGNHYTLVFTRDLSGHQHVAAEYKIETCDMP